MADCAVNPSSKTTKYALYIGIACALYFIACVLVWAHRGYHLLEDDAYYYSIVARNIYTHGVSTFDGISLTNGYHPLWLIFLVIKYAVAGASPVATLFCEAVLCSAGLFFLLKSVPSSDLLGPFVFATAYIYVVHAVAMNGMEVSIFLCCFGRFISFLTLGDRSSRPFLIGLLAFLCVLARIDSIVFILPLLLLTSTSISKLTLVLLPLLAGCIAYAAINLLIFGVAAPVSGEIKSLGGLQINHLVIAQTCAAFHQEYFYLRGGHFVITFIVMYVLVFFANLVFGAYYFIKKYDFRLCLSYLIGCILFSIKLVFFSSWEVWPWYGFSIIIGLHALYSMRGYISLKVPAAFRLIAKPLLVTLCLVLLVRPLIRSRQISPFDSTNAQAVRQFSPIFKGATVAMGDRSGSFADSYSGSVVQLEGIVNDKTYFDLMRTHGDIAKLLCKRNVKYVLSYQKDFGSYSQIAIPVMRPFLTQYQAPSLHFSSADEVGRILGLGPDGKTFDEAGDNYLYAWRMPCQH